MKTLWGNVLITVIAVWGIMLSGECRAGEIICRQCNDENEDYEAIEITDETTMQQVCKKYGIPEAHMEKINLGLKEKLLPGTIIIVPEHHIEKQENPPEAQHPDVVKSMDKLPVYDTPAWHKLPGMKKVRADAEKGDVDALYLLGRAIREGRRLAGLPSDVVYEEWEYKSYVQGLYIFDSPLAGRNPAKVIEKYRKYANKGFYLAQRILAELLIETDPTAAVNWWRKAADQGDDPSQFNFGRACMQGEGIPQNTEKALKYWELAAAQGNSGALKDLGAVWFEGRTGKVDIAKAISYYQRAAEKNSSEAAFLLGEIYSQGQGVKVDKDLAIKYFSMAAAKEPNVADMRKRAAENYWRQSLDYEQQKNFAMRDKCLRSAIELGHEKAAAKQLRLKFFAVNEKEKDEVIKQMVALAEKDNINAQRDLVFMYANLKRFDKAQTWYCRALGNGCMDILTLAPLVLFNPDLKLTAEQKNYLRGVFLLADYFDNPDMQYVAMHLLILKIFPDDGNRVEKYHKILRKKYYPRVMFPWFCIMLKEDKDLSETDKAELGLRIEKLAEYLRGLAATGDKEAAGILETYSNVVGETKK